MNHEEWLAARRLGVSGTDISVLLGLNPYKKVDDLVMDKLGIGKPFFGNAMTRAGQRLEPFVATYWATMNDKKIRQGIFTQSEIHPRFIGTPDFLLDDSGLEIKTGGERTYATGCPDMYECQSRWYMMITDKPVWDLVACIVPKDRSEIPWDDNELPEWIANRPLREYRFERSQDWEDRATQVALQFLARMDGLKADGEKLLKDQGLLPTFLQSAPGSESPT